MQKKLSSAAGSAAAAFSVVVLLLMLLFATTAARSAEVIVQTASGNVRGAVSADGQLVSFQGIPFAAPPVGELRWKAPRPVAPWSGVRDALVPGAACPQTGSIKQSEDCLFLNVWYQNKRRGPLPVMVWLHGGGQRLGSSQAQDPTQLLLRGQPVVYVAMNYRLNIFSFFAHSALTAEDPELGSGNLALLDQVQALRWVRDNIARFGGDPRNVTVFGISGGAQAVCILLSAPPAQGLIHKAISQSGPCQHPNFPSLAAAEARGAKEAVELGCVEPNPMPCLRSLPTATVLAKQRGDTSTVDTPGAQPAWGRGAFPLPMRDAVASGRFVKVPMIQGGTKEEGLGHMAADWGQNITAEQYPTILAKIFGQSRVADILKQYPVSNYGAPIGALGTAVGDAGMSTGDRVGGCNTYLAHQILAPQVPLYAYEFADPVSSYAGGAVRGSPHGSDQSFLFPPVNLDPARRVVSDAYIQYWTTFATTGNPNGHGHGLPTWPQYDPAEQKVMQFRTGELGVVNNLYEQHKCRFWKEQGFGTLSGPHPTAVGGRESR